MFLSMLGCLASVLGRASPASPDFPVLRTLENTAPVRSEPLGRPSALKWAARAPLGCPRALKRAARAPLGCPRALKWAAQAPLGCPRALKWAARAPLGCPRALKWAAQPPLGRSNGPQERHLSTQERSHGLCTRNHCAFAVAVVLAATARSNPL